MTRVFTVAEMVAAERAADKAGWRYADMMERAGQRVAQAILATQPVAGRSVLVLVGPGNNGGDGLVAGRYLSEAGADVAFYLLKPRSADGDDNFARLQQMGLLVLEASFDQRFRVLRTRLTITDIVIDALLGTGVTRPITGTLAQLLRQVRAGVRERQDILAAKAATGLIDVAALVAPTVAAPLVVAVDCPSGLNCDSGALDDAAISADVTVTFAGAKRGHFLFPGAAACGKLVVAEIGIDPALPEMSGVKIEVATAGLVRALLPERPLDGHKGTFGRALIVAGSQQYWGAPLLAGRGALRSGAGYAALAIPAALKPVAVNHLPEAVYPPVQAASQLDDAAGRSLLEQLTQYRACLVGPGLGESASFLEAFLAGTAADYPPLVVDADALNWLAAQPDWPRRLPAGAILTPHPGEMARLSGVSLAEIVDGDRFEIAREAAKAWGHIVLLKGAHTVVAEPSGRCIVLPFANPLLGVAGSGDVLGGVIAALLAQGATPFEAAVAGAYLHGGAAELAAESFGPAGLLAREIADHVPGVWHKLVTHTR